MYSRSQRGDLEVQRITRLIQPTQKAARLISDVRRDGSAERNLKKGVKKNEKEISSRISNGIVYVWNGRDGECSYRRRI